MSKNIKVMVQGFYGNRTITEIDVNDFDYILLGIIDKGLFNFSEYSFDRGIIEVPNAENIVVVYNKHREEEYKKHRESKSWQHIPLVNIPEIDVALYSRCIVCRMNDDGCFGSLQQEDFDKFIKYLAE